MVRDDPAVAEAIVVHAETLCKRENHLWDVINKLSIPVDLLTDHRDQRKVDFGTEEMVRAHLYRLIRGYSQSEFADQLSERSSLVKAAGFQIKKLEDAPSQQDLSYAKCNFSDPTWDIIEAAANGIRREVVEHGIISEALVPTPAPDDGDEEDTEKTKREYKREKTHKSVKLARKHALPEFKTGRASNRQYEDIELLDQVARICSNNGSAHSEGEIGYLLNDELTCDGSTLLRALKLIATPDDDDSMQLTLDSVFEENRMPKIDVIRDEVMKAFDGATDNIINSIRGDDPFDDRKTIAAIDITDDPFTVSPWEDRDKEIPKPNYPRMVNGYVDDDPKKQGYKYATITLVGDNVPIILGVEPYKQNSKWEEEDAPSYPKADLVERLLDRAQEFVDLDEVLLDRGFYSEDVYAAIEDRGLLYTTPVPRYTDDYENIEKIKAHPEADMAVEPDVEFWKDGELHHTAHFLYVPVRDDDADGNYAVFVTNRDSVDTPGEIRHVVNQYRRRWDIENQYKTIVEYLPRTSSTDYRVRLTNFVLAALIYNLWRLTDYLIKIAIDMDVRAPPVLTAKTFATVLGQFLLRVG
ncbi:transposase [Natronococcus sp. A-GB1]|uniref:transposase n=1 Tax=Natronococcus sp. A-GB1 TaxID=3037648 RepID=UPI00241E9066|nr:transposase [Natronococcus sp. A-GB1]MDG5760932.1 transposase [Natronococcus sp. A-GB1]